MTTKCDGCGLESEVEQAFKSARKWGVLRIYCPVCWSKQYAFRLKRSLCIHGLFLLLGLISLLLDHSVWLGWFLLNLFLIFFFRILLTMPHELGHAVSGYFLGMRVFRIIIGFGRTMYTRRFFGFVWEIKSIPLGGVALVVSKSARYFRLKQFLMTLSGPLANLLILLLLLALASKGHMLGGAFFCGVSPIFDLFWANILVLVTGSLLPRKFTTAYGEFATDGLALLTTPFRSQAKIREQLPLYYVLEGHFCLQEREFESAKNWLEEGLRRYPDNFIAINNLGITFIQMREFEKARDCFQKLIQMDDLNSEAKFMVLNNLAYSNVLIGNPHLLEEADRYSSEAFRSAPWSPAYRGTRGMVLVDLGRLDEGIDLLTEAMNAHEAPKDKALDACSISIAESKRGNMEEAHHYFEIARSLDPDCLLLGKVENSLGALENQNDGPRMNAVVQKVTAVDR